jgi:hypothetical protein
MTRLISVFRSVVVLLVITAFNVSDSYSQDRLKDNVGVVFKQIYDYRLLSADSSISVFETERPNHPVWSLLRANLVWWQILSGGIEDDKLKKKFIYHLNESKDKAKNFLEDEDEAAFSLIIVNAFRTRFDLLDNNYLTAASYLNACIDDISDSFGREEEYEPFYLTSGLYYYFMQKAHEDYPIMRPYLFFFPDGDKQKGIDFLLKCSSSDDIFLREESTYFLMRIAFDLDKDPKQALGYVGSLLTRYPDNIIFRLFEIKALRSLNLEKEINFSEKSYRASVSGNLELTLNQKKYFFKLLEDEKKAPN